MQLDKYINSGNIRSLFAVFKSWVDIVERYMAYFGYSDNPWWYNERATLSSLAAAVWAAEGVALEEYSTEKGKRRDSWKGRCDLFIGIGAEHFALEAKQVWCAIGRRAKGGYATVEAGLQSACSGARNLDKDEGRRLAICFAVPYLPASDGKNINVQLKKWLGSLQKLDYSSIAWVFPKQARRLASSDGYFYPGAVLLSREVFRQVS